MIIERLDLLAFGKFTNVSLDFSATPKQFHLVYGPNESGKSTCLRAITSLLFGMEHRTTDNYLHNHAQMRVGGVFVDGDKSLHCIRRRGRKATLRASDDQEIVDETILQSMLGGIDREAFLTRFGLTRTELVDGGAAILAGEGDLGEILFAAGAGITQLRAVQAELKESRDRLFVPRGSRVINQSIKEFDEHRKQLRSAQIQPAQFNELRDRLQSQRQVTDRLDAKVQSLATELSLWRAYDQALPLMPEWKSTIEQLASVADVPILDQEVQSSPPRDFVTIADCRKAEVFCL